MPFEQPQEQFPNPANCQFLSLWDIQSTDHLARTDYAQGLDLGSARCRGGAEAAGHCGPIATDRTEGRGKHGCTRGWCAYRQENAECKKSEEEEKELRRNAQISRVFPTSSVIFGSAPRVSPNSELIQRVDALKVVVDAVIDGRWLPNQPIMDQEAVPLGNDVQVVDPDVRGYVYSLVTAVSSSLWKF